MALLGALHPQFTSELADNRARSLKQRPNFWLARPGSLLTTCTVNNITLGTGASIYSSIEPLLQSTEHELILVTCFWARSESLSTINKVLFYLSDKASRQNKKIKVRICVSSVSLWQKVFHTQSLDGFVYPPEAREGKLGLPPAQRLKGLDLQVKSIFVKPFSVMHPKFIIIDRKRVLLPSCNVSWENWFEGCIGLEGSITEKFVEFWRSFWADGDDRAEVSFPTTKATSDGSAEADTPKTGVLASVNINKEDMPCVFLPSPHSINPRFRPFPWQRAVDPPPTPLNVFVLTAIRRAEQSIYMQTPNLTAPPVLRAIQNALGRGVSVHIVTSEKLMILEQLGTAGTTTVRCVRSLIKKHGSKKRLCDETRWAEAGQLMPKARSRIEYYQPKTSGSGKAEHEPVQSHLKLTVIDDKIFVLGSGNMDRASWYTSQELGVAFESTEICTTLTTTLSKAMRDRSKLVYDSESG